MRRDCGVEVEGEFIVLAGEDANVTWESVNLRDKGECPMKIGMVGMYKSSKQLQSSISFFTATLKS